MAREHFDLNEAVLKLQKKKHVDPAIILVTPSETKSIGPIDQRWEIGSITKVFTALLLAQLQHTGRISITETVASYLPKTLDLPKTSKRLHFRI